MGLGFKCLRSGVLGVFYFVIWVVFTFGACSMCCGLVFVGWFVVLWLGFIGFVLGYFVDYFVGWYCLFVCFDLWVLCLGWCVWFVLLVVCFFFVVCWWVGVGF